MRRMANTRIAALIAALTAGALAAYTLRSSPATRTGSGGRDQQQAADIRTQVIRRTVHIVRHESPHRSHGQSINSARSAAVTGATGGVPRSASSGSHALASGAVAQAGAPRTRTSGAVSTGAPSVGSAGGGTVRTRTSGTSISPSHAPSGGPVRTRTSGAGAGSSSPNRALRTRASGAGERSDRGDGHGD